MSLILNSITISEKCQERIKRFRDRVFFKEYLSIPMAEVMNELRYKASAEDRLQRFRDCGKYISIDPESGQILKANFCKQRLCPVCNYISSCIAWHKISKSISFIRANHPAVQFVFMTVTIRNCTADELSKKLDEVLQGFRRLTNRKTWKDRTLGVLRGLEITYNSKSQTYHPHIHMLVAVEGDYFSRENKKYIDIETLRKWWTESARLDYHVQVDIRKVDSEDNAVAEVAKYAVKTADILKTDSDDEQIKATYTLHQCIYGRRLKATTGVFKTAFKELKLGDLDELELDSVGAHESAVDLIFDDNKADYDIKGVVENE